MAWTLKWDDHAWTDADLTVGHVAAIVQLQGVDSWEQLEPFAGPNRLLGVLAVFIAADEERPVEDVIRELAARPAVDLLNSLSRTEDPKPTKSK